MGKEGRDSIGTALWGASQGWNLGIDVSSSENNYHHGGRIKQEGTIYCPASSPASLLPAARFPTLFRSLSDFTHQQWPGSAHYSLPRAAAAAVAAAATAFSNRTGMSELAGNDSSFIVQLDQVS